MQFEDSETLKDSSHWYLLFPHQYDYHITSTENELKAQTKYEPLSLH